MPKVYGTLNLDYGFLSNFSFGSQMEFPQNPKPGNTIMKDGRLLACVAIEGGNPLWVPLTNQISMRKHQQATPSSRWTFVHGMNVGTPVVQAWGADGSVMFPSDITVVDPNTIEVFFPTPVAGALTVMAGIDTGIPALDIALEVDVDEASPTWTVTHNLGYNPTVYVLIDGYEVQPQSVVHDSIAQTTITLNDARTGKVILV